ncbi:MAG: hypothetical protein LBL90_10350 [Prevotellaceae bacterium]|jgi:hypothetical protein|nr:hypothetical protein [Prevotellaceae bacterium]
MKKITATIIFILIIGAVNAQSWQGIVTHNGYLCHSLGSLVNHTVLAAKGKDALGAEWINVKVKSPYRWSDTHTANATINGISTQLHYSKGRIYLSVLVCGNKVCNSEIYDNIILYQNNDWQGNSRAVTLSLKTLEINKLPLNSKEFETYW